jgi:SOS-response transcriptional repressor LexA
MVKTAQGEYVVIEAQFPGHASEAIGVLLIDAEADRPYVRFRRDLESLAEDDTDLELLGELPSDLEAKAADMGAGRFLTWLEENASNVIRVTDRESVLVDSFDNSVERLYRKHVTPKILPFRTHLPKYSVRAAAGRFGENMEVEPEGWEEIPPDIRSHEDMFVAHVVGRSMEPVIPDGSLCVFRSNVTGSRQGRLVLVMNYGETGENRFTVKRYRSLKRRAGSDAGGEWSHSRIILEPLNPEYEAWELTPDSKIKVIGEFVRVLRTGD